MEALPEKIIDKIFDQIFCENPRGLYRLRLVSKTWKKIIDRCASRLLEVWCEKCSNKIPENDLDDIVHTWCPQFASWQEYCTSVRPLPHIARDIYISANKFSNLTHSKISLSEICPSTREKFIYNYALSDKYFAIHFSMQHGDESKWLCIYPINDLSHCIREYSISPGKMDFYATDNQDFLVIQEHYVNTYEKKSIYLAEFLVKDYLNLSNLPVDDSINIVITNNQCFTYSNGTSDSFRHYRMTVNGFEMSTIVELPHCSYPRQISKIQISHSWLFLSARVQHDPREISSSKTAIYKYQITRESNGLLLFSSPKIYQRNIIDNNDGLNDRVPIFMQLHISFGADNIPLHNHICHLYPSQFTNWMSNYFKAILFSITVYTYHVIITCSEKIIVFQGTLRQLMDYAVKNADPGSRCTVIDLTSITDEIQNLFVLGIHVCVLDNISQPKFLMITMNKAFTVDLIP